MQMNITVDLHQQSGYPAKAQRMKLYLSATEHHEKKETALW